ncbi:nickel ABC transporter permease [Paenibacillus senegalensis]|uniref:nickel ABC transporter permease n=1 Tax=Paenibacillus senegalensis TaxID=1465766 RepID=UPI000289B48A|nr:nickel ABC transporter permease [Paenibacillus senegalensis]
MLLYIWKRLASGLLVLFGVSVLSFSLIHLIPGDPVRLMLGEQVTQEQVEQMREELGLNRPVPHQYIDYMAGVIQGDFGTSLKSDRPVLQEIMERFPATIKLAVSGIAIAIVLGVAMGVLAAKYKDTFIDTAFKFLTSLGVSLPSFWLGILMIMFFAVYLKWFPIAGGTGLDDLVLPALTLGILVSATIARMTRSGMVEVMSNEYIRTARAKGLSETTVLFKHAFRNVMIPIVTFIGLQAASLMGGAVIIEKVFSWSGIGTLAINAISQRDFPMLQGVVLFMGIVYVVINIIVDIVYSVIDPRVDVRAEGGASNG